MILAEFNARLADRGIASISKSAWGRYSVRKAIQFRKLDQVHHISGELAATLGTDGPDHVTMLIAEMVKVAAFQLLEGGDVSTKGMMELSRAVATSVGAQKKSAEHLQHSEAEVVLRVVKADEDVVEVGGAAGNLPAP